MGKHLSYNIPEYSSRKRDIESILLNPAISEKSIMPCSCDCRFVLVYLLQRLSVAVKRGDVGSLLGTVGNQDGPLSVFI